MSTPPIGGITRCTGAGTGRVSASKNGATGWCALTHDSTAWMMIAPMNT